MEHSDAGCAKARDESLAGLGSQGDFGDEDDCAFVLFEHFGDEAQVDFGFTAAGYAAQEMDVEGGDSGGDGVDDALLVGGWGGRGGR